MTLNVPTSISWAAVMPKVMNMLCTTPVTEGLLTAGANLAALAGLDAHREGLSQGAQLMGHAWRQVMAQGLVVLAAAMAMP